MSTINIANARTNLYEIFDEDFESLMETLYLQSAPKLTKDLQELNDDTNALASRNDLEWQIKKQPSGNCCFLNMSQKMRKASQHKLEKKF